MVKRICDLISSLMGVIILLSAVLALYFPSYFSFLSPSIINPMLGVVMLGMGLTLNPSDFKTVFSRLLGTLYVCEGFFGEQVVVLVICGINGSAGLGVLMEYVLGGVYPVIAYEFVSLPQVCHFVVVAGIQHF